MSIWDTLTGRKSTSPPTSQSPQSPQSQSPQSSRTDFAPEPTFDPTSATDVSSFLNAPGAFDPAVLHPLAGLNQDTLDYLSLEDSALSNLPGSRSALPSRGWSDDLCYGTGVTYLSALTLGGAWGLAEGLNRAPAGAPPKLRLNAVLNSVTRRGPFLGNNAGVLALVYNGINSFIGHQRGKHDAFNSVAAGGISGMIFKSTRGVKPMLISGGMVAGVAGSWAVARKVLF
ncbi:putative mitochondrial import inner membrane translocase subunit TIM23 [Patellaria atrata CBS 101060]|uniref:Mitochondrial import inner membrane translocase subunit TIM23 n=1 Tax=Patellaria atrata CBS 101060 TaxID=1346257 RepID=A0A9P4VRG0_9PEZI|nr:putative mitochondrial import inner membrane translocase subunit TIM23 [Patellaria atrata CBS 101060]